MLYAWNYTLIKKKNEMPKLRFSEVKVLAPNHMLDK